jgi:acyl-CoA reductase-like NAD-dependent aldehyde dehydrogenase
MAVADVDLDALPTPGSLIDGQMHTDPTDEIFPHLYAANGKLTHEVPLGGEAEMDAAVTAARKAFPAWKRMAPNDRRNLMTAFAREVRRQSDALARLITAENGSPTMGVGGMPTWVAELFEYNAGFTDKIGGQVVKTWGGPTDAFDYTLDEPWGVIAVIVPWNGPFVSFGQTLAPALAAGNTVVIKPPEFAPYSCLRLGQIATEAGFPPGVINVVPGGPTGGNALVSHPGVDKIFFTGSGGTARKIQAAAIANLTPAGFELGGKSARLVFADADLDAAARHALSAAVGLAGQACIAGTRVLVEDSVYDQVIVKMTEIASQIPIGDPRDPSTIMGPVISAGAVDRIMGFIDRATSAGCGLAFGGKRLGGELADGYFIQPTIFADMDNSEEVTRQEIFGPVVSVLRFHSEEEAVAIANDTDYGLAAYIETTDLKRAHRVSAALDAGTVWVNGFFDLPVGAPFGGVKQSGFGRVGGQYGIQEFTRPKNVWMSL